MLIITMMAQYRSATANTLLLYKHVAWIWLCRHLTGDRKQESGNNYNQQLIPVRFLELFSVLNTLT